MLKKVFMIPIAVCLLLLGGCKGTLERTHPDGTKDSVSVEIDPHSGQDSDPDARPMGEGELTLKDGSKFRGTCYDTDGDGFPDKFQPYLGQGHAELGHKVTDGRTWYDIEVKGNIDPR